MRAPEPHRSAGAGTVLLLGNYRPTIAVARALAEAGHRVIVGHDGEPLGAHSSRFVDEIWDHPELPRDPAGFLEALTDLLGARPDIETVMPISEEFVLFLAAHADAIAARARIASPRPDLIETFTDKAAALSLAREQGVPTLPFVCVTDYAALLGEASEMGFPVTVRGLGATARLGGRKALICHDRNELGAALPEWPDGHSRLLVQRFAAGRRHNIYFAAHAGHIIALAATEILRTDAPDGTGLAVDGRTEHPDDRLVGDTQELIAATSYTGIGLAQFIVDSDRGDRCFLELNPRVSGSHAVAEQAGLPLARLAVELAATDDGRSPITCAPRILTGKPGLRYAWTDGDLLAAKYALISGEISAAGAARWVLRSIQTAVRADVHMVWRWRDPGPAVVSLLLLMPWCGPLRAAIRRWFASRRAVLPDMPARRHQSDSPQDPALGTGATNVGCAQ